MRKKQSINDHPRLYQVFCAGSELEAKQNRPWGGGKESWGGEEKGKEGKRRGQSYTSATFPMGGTPAQERKVRPFEERTVELGFSQPQHVRHACFTPQHYQKQVESGLLKRDRNGGVALDGRVETYRGEITVMIQDGQRAQGPSCVSSGLRKKR